VPEPVILQLSWSADELQQWLHAANESLGDSGTNDAEHELLAEIVAEIETALEPS